ncbi:hypothetical protein [Streptomyces sp. NPDC054863]
MSALGYPRDLVDSEALCAREDFRQALASAVSSTLPTLLQADGSDEPSGTGRLIVRRFSGPRSLRCAGEGTTLTVIAGTWDLIPIIDHLPGQSDPPSGTYGLPMKVKGTALITEDGTQSGTIEFSPLNITIGTG